MMESIIEYVDIVFDQYERTRDLEDLREEIIQNASEHLDDCMRAGMSRAEAEKAVREGMGDLNAMLKEIGAVKKMPNRKKMSIFVETDHILHNVFGSVFRGETRTFRWDNIHRVEISGTDMDVCAENGSGTELEAELKGSEADCIFSVKNGTLLAEQSRKCSGEVFLRLRLPQQVTELQCRLKSGDVELEGIELENCSLHTISGDVEAEDSRIHSFAADTVSGDVDLADMHIGSAEISTVSGDADVEAESLERIRIHTLSGDADLDAPVFEEADIETTSGDVSCELHGAEDMEISTDTVSGDVFCRYDSRGNSRRLSVRTVSGDIDIA